MYSSVRHLRNMPSISESDQALLKEKKAAVIGCGGLGGYITEFLARAGVGHITVADGDIFDETNLNRQILCTEENIGGSKAEAAEKRIHAIDCEITVTTVKEFLTESNAVRILSGHDVVMDALDSVSARRLLGKVCSELDIPLIHGAVSGWNVQVSLIPPHSSGFQTLYSEEADTEQTVSCLSFVPAFCASVQAAEAIKLLTEKKPSLFGKLFSFDLLNMESFSVQIS